MITSTTTEDGQQSACLCSSSISIQPSFLGLASAHSNLIRDLSVPLPLLTVERMAGGHRHPFIWATEAIRARRMWLWYLFTRIQMSELSLAAWQWETKQRCLNLAFESRVSLEVLNDKQKHTGDMLERKAFGVGWKRAGKKRARRKSPLIFKLTLMKTKMQCSSTLHKKWHSRSKCVAFFHRNENLPHTAEGLWFCGALNALLV